MGLPDKSRVFDAVIGAMRARLQQTQETLSHTHKAATHEEARADNKYDTRGLEMSFLATGLTDRIAELRQVLSAYHFWTLPEQDDVIRPGAFVRLVDDDDRELLCFVAPYGAAETIVVAGQTIRVITLKAPLGRALVGKSEGDEVIVKVAGQAHVWEVDQLK
ncbi:MAG: GreA/GreB family elongation factor [Myxococcales bacterium]|nr:GreA/GreB family elongation factor [Myxococcales bacterium]